MNWQRWRQIAHPVWQAVGHESHSKHSGRVCIFLRSYVRIKMAEACINRFIGLWEMLVSTVKIEEQRKEEDSKMVTIPSTRVQGSTPHVVLQDEHIVVISTLSSQSLLKLIMYVWILLILSYNLYLYIHAMVFFESVTLTQIPSDRLHSLLRSLLVCLPILL